MTVRHHPQKALLALLLGIPMLYVGYAFYYRETHTPPRDVRKADDRDFNEREQYHEMVAAYQKLLQKYPLRNEVRYSLAWAYYKTGEWARAGALMKEYVENNPFYPEYRRRYVQTVLSKALS